MSTTLEDLILPGSELQPIPLTDSDQPIVVRITNAIPHGDSYRYNLVFYGLDEGNFDLGKYLQRIEGTDAVPKIPVEITSILKDGRVKPNELSSQQPPTLGGYRTLMIVAAILWAVGLLVLLFAGRRKRESEADAVDNRKSLADELRPMVRSAIEGKLSDDQRSRLERLLLAYWRKRLGVADADPGEAMTVMRNDPGAGELIRNLEDWLHRPDPPKSVDIEKLLEPYKNISDEPVAQTMNS